MVAIGIDLGGTNIKAALIDQKNGFVNTVSVPTNAEMGKEYVFDRIAEVVDELTAHSSEKPIGIGMGLPGMVSMDRKIVKYPPNLPGWKEERVSEELKKRTGLDCVIENDGNLAALGSARFGVGKSFENFITITLGTGVGGGIIYQNKIFRGSTGMAAELGHVIIDYHGPLSNSNTRGGIEAYLGQRFLSRYAADTIRQDTDNPLYTRFHRDFDKLEPVDLYNAAKEGNELAIEILRKSGEKLGFAIVNYIHVLDFRKVIVSGGVAKAGDFILQPARDTAKRLLMSPFTENFEILYESLGNDAALLGAASLAFEEL